VFCGSSRVHQRYSGYNFTCCPYILFPPDVLLGQLYPVYAALGCLSCFLSLCPSPSPINALLPRQLDECSLLSETETPLVDVLLQDCRIQVLSQHCSSVALCLSISGAAESRSEFGQSNDRKAFLDPPSLLHSSRGHERRCQCTAREAQTIPGRGS
jgi:hypothetical protein